jgi:hypothetical protein
MNDLALLRSFSNVQILQESLMLLCSKPTATIIGDFVSKAEGGAETAIAA